MDATGDRARRAPRVRVVLASGRSSTTSAGSTTTPATSRAALDAFERALGARAEDEGNAQATEIARFAVGKTLRALGRADDAIPLLEQAVAWAEAQNAPDGWFHEELAEEYAAVGRAADAGAQAALAIPLLERDDPSFAGDAERSARLAALASA